MLRKPFWRSSWASIYRRLLAKDPHAAQAILAQQLGEHL
jgi:hypothetical protein